MKTHIFLAFLLSSLCTLCLCGESSAALDPELKTPYQLKIVLHFADHRLLTPVFCDRVERELHDGLQASFGDLVNDIVVTRQDAHLNDVLQNGLKSLDNWRERSPVKTHFVLIDYSGVDYTIQARQFDGLTGRPSPVVRLDRTRDRGFVAKTAALLIDQDFGLVGTFDTWPKEDKPGEDKPGEDKPVVVNLKGGSLGVPLDRWIKKGDLFAAVQMPFGDAAPGKPVEGALLRVETPPAGADSTCLCRPFRRYPPLTGGAGYRCVKLGTVSAPLRLRLRQALANNRDGPLNDALSVQIRRHGFDDETMTKVQKKPDALDAVDTAGDKDAFYNGVAFVTVVSSDGKVRARVPVPILDDQSVVLAVNVSNDAGAELAFKKAAWERDVTQTWQEQNEWIREINEGVKAEKHADVIAKIEEGQKRFQSEVNRLTAQQAELKIGQGNQDVERLKQVQDGIAKLMEYRDKLKKIDEEQNDPKKKEWLAQAAQGKQLEDDWELGKAIALYEELLKADAPNEKLKKDLAEHLDKLRKEWEPKSDGHREARAFIYNDWPEIKDDAVLLEKLPEARKAFEVCKTVKDKAGLIRLFKGTEIHAVRMNQELKTLKPDINIDDEKQAKTIQDVSKGLAELARDVNAALARAAPAGK
jgi:hypothetical protein